MEKLLKKLVEAPSISGSEKNVRDLIAKELKPHASEIKVDRIGNLIARKGRGKPRIMLCAHMDEIGLMVKHIDEKGFIRFDTVGGWDQRILLAQKMKIYGSKGPVVGVIGSKPVHIQEADEQKRSVKLKDMFIDIGAKDSKDVEKAGIKQGDFITNYGSFNTTKRGRVTGYGLDNRIGCTVMIEVMKALKSFKGTVYAVGTIQEETGLIGVRGSAFGIDPDVVLGLDTTIAGDMPGVKPEEATSRIGEGPVMLVKDRVMIVNPRVKKWIEDTAKSIKIPIQYEVLDGGATDASITPTVRDGIPSGAVLVATRYIHTPVEVADMKDVKNAVKLVVKLVQTANKYF